MDANVLRALKEDPALTRIDCRGRVGVINTSVIPSAGGLHDLFHYCNTDRIDSDFKPGMSQFVDPFGGLGGINISTY